MAEAREKGKNLVELLLDASSDRFPYLAAQLATSRAGDGSDVGLAKAPGQLEHDSTTSQCQHEGVTA
jgi:hypothetical protein